MKEVFEKLGLFYLGKDVDKNTLDATDALTLLRKRLITRASSKNKNQVKTNR